MAVTGQPAPTYARARQREGKVPTSVRFYQSLGGLPDTWKSIAFHTFLLFYYNQVLGVSASAAAMVILVALVVDAVTDPVVGSISDNLQTRLGRRHPLMYAAIAPLGLMLYLTFSPPAGLSETLLIAWMLMATVGTRVAMTFFVLPWNALFAEFSDDYAERSAIVTWRYVTGWTGSVIFTFCVWSFIFPTSAAYDPGHLDPAAWEVFAPVVALLVVTAAFLTTYLTRDQVPYLLQPQGVQERFSFGRVVREVASALRNRDFLNLFLGVLSFSAIAGAIKALEIYMLTYFWGLRGEDIRWLTFSFLGAVIAFICVPALQQKFDKKMLVLFAIGFNTVNEFVLVGLRFADVLPDNGDPLLLVLLISNDVIRTAVGTTAAIMFVSMVADVLDAQELHTQRRQEGVFSASLSFSAKATSGFGVLIAGLMLDYVVGFPRDVRPPDMPSGVIVQLGIVTAMALPLLYALPVWLYSRYSITRETHEHIREQLTAQRAGNTPPARPADSAPVAAAEPVPGAAG